MKEVWEYVVDLWCVFDCQECACWVSVEKYRAGEKWTKGRLS